MTQLEAQEFTVSYAEQIANKFDVDITTCPSCGYVSIQPNNTEDCTCPICGTVADFADFPSLFYSSMEWGTPETTEKHDKLRNILIEFGNPEYGDAIIDKICMLFGYSRTPEE